MLRRRGGHCGGEVVKSRLPVTLTKRFTRISMRQEKARNLSKSFRVQEKPPGSRAIRSSTRREEAATHMKAQPDKIRHRESGAEATQYLAALCNIRAASFRRRCSSARRRPLRPRAQRCSLSAEACVCSTTSSTALRARHTFRSSYCDLGETGTIGDRGEGRFAGHIQAGPRNKHQIHSAAISHSVLISEPRKS